MKNKTAIAACLVLVAALSMGACSGGVDSQQLNATADSLQTTGMPDTAATMGARALLMDKDEFAEAQAQVIVDGLEKGSLSADAATQQMNEVYAIAVRVGREDCAKAFYEALDRLAADLPVDRQMLVYCHATSPAALGAALKAEKAKNGADQSLIADQIAAARKIYTGKDLEAFDNALK